MTLVRWNPRTPARFNNLMGDLFAHTPSFYGSEFTTTKNPVNIFETENGYELQMLAPGFLKESFDVVLEKNLLTITAKPGKEEEGRKALRNEFVLKPVKRSFTVDDTIQEDAISAQYVNGVLTLNLPRKAEVSEATKKITVQ